MIDPGVVLEKLVVGFANPDAPQSLTSAPTGSVIPSSYLGPPESYRRIDPAAAAGRGAP